MVVCWETSREGRQSERIKVVAWDRMAKDHHALVLGRGFERDCDLGLSILQKD